MTSKDTICAKDSSTSGDISIKTSLENVLASWWIIGAEYVNLLAKTSALTTFVFETTQRYLEGKFFKRGDTAFITVE